MHPYLVHAVTVLKHALPLLVGYAFGRYAGDRNETWPGRIAWCLLAIVGSTLLEFVGYSIWVAWLFGNQGTLADFSLEGLLYGWMLFGFIVGLVSAPFTCVGYLFGLFIRRRAGAERPGHETWSNLSRKSD